MRDLHNPVSASLYERAQKVMPGGNTRTTVFRQPHQVYAARGEGCRIIDVDGNARIDANGNFTALIHGYGQPDVAAAAARQLALGTSFGMATESEIVLSEILCERLPSVERLRYTNSGTEAVMNAIKAARAFTERPRSPNAKAPITAPTIPPKQARTPTLPTGEMPTNLCRSRRRRARPGAFSTISSSSRSTMSRLPNGYCGQTATRSPACWSTSCRTARGWFRPATPS